MVRPCGRWAGRGMSLLGRCCVHLAERERGPRATPQAAQPLGGQGPVRPDPGLDRAGTPC
jgi:hypothetical protein